jgi:hypothetical protein
MGAHASEYPAFSLTRGEQIADTISLQQHPFQAVPYKPDLPQSVTDRGHHIFTQFVIRRTGIMEREPTIIDHPDLS